MAADNEIQIPAETGQAGGEVETNEQNLATSQETQLDGAETQKVKPETTQRAAGEPTEQTSNLQAPDGEVTDVRVEKIRNGAPDGTRKNRCRKHDGSEALEHPGREALAQFLAAPRSLREFKSYSALANYFHMSRMTIYRWRFEVEVMQRAYFLTMRNEIAGDLEARRAWPEIMRKQVANAKGGDLDATRFCELHAWRPNPRVEQSHLSVSVSTLDLFGTNQEDEADELQDDDRQSQGDDR